MLAFLGNCSKVLNHLLCVFRLSSSGLSSHQNRLVLMSLHHVLERQVGDGEDVWGYFISVAVSVASNCVLVVDGERSVGVDSDQEEA